MDPGSKGTSSKMTPSCKWSIVDLGENTLIIKRFLQYEQVIHIM